MREHAQGGALTEPTLFILLSLCRPRHGYAIRQMIREETGGRLELGAGTLYGALNTLSDKGWIAPCGTEHGRKKEYQLTEQGRAALQQELIRLRNVSEIAETILRRDFP